MIPIALALHALAAVVWVGGMFFAYLVLRPVAAAQLQPPQRLMLWRGVFERFFLWVWGAVIILPLTGYGLIGVKFGGMGASPLYVHVMHGFGLLMIALFLHLFFVPYRRLHHAVKAENWPAGGKALGQIRTIVGVNLVLGLIVVAVAIGGPYWLI